MGSITPRVETYHQAIKEKFQILKKSPSLVKNISIVDMNSEKYVISNPLEAGIEKTLAEKQKILLVLNRKGEGTKFSCTDCSWIALCEKCGLPLVPQKAKNVCYRCELNFSPLATCPKCQSIHLKAMGLGTARLKKFLTDLFPQTKIIQVEKDSDGRELRSNWDIAITTSYGLKLNWPKIDLTGIMDADQGLNFPDYSSPQKTFQILYKFLRIGERGIIQTHLPASPAGGPENYVIRNLAALNYEKFFLEEIIQRQKYGFPPDTHLVRLLFKDADEEKVISESKSVYQKLTNNQSPVITISKPHPAFIRQERGKFRYQIIIKTKKQLDKKIKDFLRTLPKGWIIDVDPVNLL